MSGTYNGFTSINLANIVNLMPRIVPKEWNPWFTLQNGYFMATHLLKHVFMAKTCIMLVCACVT